MERRLGNKQPAKEAVEGLKARGEGILDLSHQVTGKDLSHEDAQGLTATQKQRQEKHARDAALLAEQKDLIATVPSKLAQLQLANNRVQIMPPPFEIPPFELKMVWSPLLQNNPEHQWMRHLISETAATLDQS